MIGLALAFVKPRIDEIQDRGVIEQSITLLEDIDDVVKSIGDPGNQRVIEIGIRKGSLKIDGTTEELVFELESGSEFSEAGEEYIQGDVLVQTKKIGNLNDVNLTVSYSNHNLKFDGKDPAKFTAGFAEQPQYYDRDKAPAEASEENYQKYYIQRQSVPVIGIKDECKNPGNSAQRPLHYAQNNNHSAQQ